MYVDTVYTTQPCARVFGSLLPTNGPAFAFRNPSGQWWGQFDEMDKFSFLVNFCSIHNTVQGIGSTVQYSTVQYSTVQYSTVQYSTVQYSTVQYSTVQYSTVQYSTVQYSTVQYSTVQYSTVQYSTVQYSTVQYSTVQYSTVQYSVKNSKIPLAPWRKIFFIKTGFI